MKMYDTKAMSWKIFRHEEDGRTGDMMMRQIKPACFEVNKAKVQSRFYQVKRFGILLASVAFCGVYSAADGWGSGSGGGWESPSADGWGSGSGGGWGSPSGGGWGSGSGGAWESPSGGGWGSGSGGAWGSSSGGETWGSGSGGGTWGSTSSTRRGGGGGGGSTASEVDELIIKLRQQNEIKRRAMQKKSVPLLEKIVIKKKAQIKKLPIDRFSIDVKTLVVQDVFCEEEDRSLMEMLAERLPASIQMLDISSNRLDNLDVKVLAKVTYGLRNSWSHHNHLKTLILADNQIGDQGAIALAKNMINVLGGLEILDLSYNEIGDDGVIALAKRFPVRLSKLRMDKNLITSKGAKALGYYMPNSLTTLYLSGNDIDEEGLKHLGRRLPRSMALLHILKDNSYIIEEYEKEYFKNWFKKKHPTLKVK